MGICVLNRLCGFLRNRNNGGAVRQLQIVLTKIMSRLFEVHHGYNYFVFTLTLLYGIMVALGQTDEGHFDQSPENVRQYFSDLLDRQDSRFRPVRDIGNPVIISMRLTLYQILDVNEKEQSLLVYMWGSQKWRDEFAYWDPALANGQNEISFRTKDLWKPDTYLYNGIESTIEETDLLAKVNASDPGYATITQLFPAIYKLTCNMHIRYFPYDIQHCQLHFGSWSFDTRAIDYIQESPEIQMDQYLTNSEWAVVNVSTERTLVKYKCCPAPYAQLYFHIVIKRKPLYYIMNVIFPTVIISAITIFGFFCPSQVSGDRGEKITLGMTSLFAMSVYLLIVAADIPTTSDLIPIISIFYVGIICFITVGTLITAFMITLQQRGRFGKPVPDKLRWFVVHVVGKRFCCFKPPDFMLMQSNTSKAIQNHQVVPICPTNMAKITANSLHDTIDQDQISITKPEWNAGLSSDVQQIAIKLKKIIELLKSHNEASESHFSDEDEGQILELEWEWCVNVLEQVCLWTFMFILVIFVITIMIVFQSNDEGH